MIIDLLPLFSNPVINSILEEVDAERIYNSLIEKKFLKTDYSISSDTEINVGITEDLHILDCFPDLKVNIEKVLDYYIKEILEYRNCKYKITTSWGTISHPNSIGQPHVHCNSWLSGVWYPKKCSDICFFKKMYSSWQIGTPDNWNSYNSQEWKISPKENTLLIFDSDLQHRITKNTSDLNRYSIAFNVLPVGKIGTGDSTIYLSAK